MMALVLVLVSLIALEGSIPSPYYVDAPCPGLSLAGLQQAIGMGIMVSYQEGVFDCSNMAALLQWRLKSQGYNAKICLSSQFQDGPRYGYHAWVAVDLGGIRYYLDPPEPALLTIGPDDERYACFNNPAQVYDNLSDLLQEHPYPKDWSWWNRLNFSVEAQNLGMWGRLK